MRRKRTFIFAPLLTFLMVTHDALGSVNPVTTKAAHTCVRDEKSNDKIGQCITGDPESLSGFSFMPFGSAKDLKGFDHANIDGQAKQKELGSASGFSTFFIFSN